MANCFICSTELKFGTKTVLGAGNLSNGEALCNICFTKLYKANTAASGKLKSMPIDEVRNLFQDLQNVETSKTSRINEIKSQIQNLKISGVSSYLGRKEIDELPKILADTEVIDNIAQGTYNKGMGILVSTNRRLLFVDKGMLYGLKVEDFPLDKITSIQYETGIMFGEIKIHTSGNIAKIDNLDKTTARNFAEFVRNKLSQPKQETTTTIINQPNVLDQLEKLAKLKESGILSEEEFNEQKRKLLEKL